MHLDASSNPVRNILKNTALGLPKLSVLCALLIPVAAMAAPFTNGGFESPGIPAGSQVPIGPGFNEPTGWVAGGTASPGSFSLFYQHAIWFPGDNSVGFGGNGTTGASISQTFDTIAGQSYTVNYQATQQQGISPQSFLVEAFNGASLIASVSFSVPAYGAGETFHFFNGTPLIFNAVSGSTTLTFLDTTTLANSGPSNFAIDNVSVNGVVGAVPEPETYALLLGGLALVGAMARRPKSA